MDFQRHRKGPGLKPHFYCRIPQIQEENPRKLAPYLIPLTGPLPCPRNQKNYRLVVTQEKFDIARYRQQLEFLFDLILVVSGCDGSERT